MSMEVLFVLENGDVVVHKRGLDRIRRGHLWVYRSDVQAPSAIQPGSIVRVRDQRGSIIAKAFYSSQSQITLRLLVRGDASIDRDFFQKRFEAADLYRQRLDVDPRLSRRIFGEGDLLPGLVVDRYN